MKFARIKQIFGADGDDVVANDYGDDDDGDGPCGNSDTKGKY